MRKHSGLMFRILLFAAIMILLLSCSDRPENVWNNPVDPDNSATGGDPYLVTASIADGGILLEWANAFGLNVAGFNVYRQDNEGGFVLYASLSGAQSTFTDLAIENGHRYDYYVVAKDASGNEANATNVASISIDTDPVVIINGDEATTGSRHVELTIIAYQADRMRISNTPQVEDLDWVAYSSSIEWNLATGAEDVKHVYVQVDYDESGHPTSDVASDSILPRFPSNLGFQILNTGSRINNPDSTTRNYITLDLNAFDADSVQVAQNPEFTGGVWLQFADQVAWDLAGNPVSGIINGDQRSEQKSTRAVQSEVNKVRAKKSFTELDEFTETMATESNEYTVYVRFKNDFEVVSEALSDHIIVEIPSSVEIELGEELVSRRHVLLTLISIDATQMALDTSLTALLENPQWRYYVENVHEFELPPGIGMKYVYARFRNDTGAESSVFVDSVGTRTLQPALEVLTDNYPWTNVPQVTLSMPDVGATEMKIAEVPDQNSVLWIPYQSLFQYDLDPVDGEKDIYVWFRNDFYEEEYLQETIYLDRQVEIQSFSWTGSGGDIVEVGDQITFTLQMADDGNGTETGGNAWVEVENMFDHLDLVDRGDGSYEAVLDVTADYQAVIDALVTVHFTDRAGNTTPPALADRTISFWVDSGAEGSFDLGDSGLTVDMIWVAPASFEMGARDDEVGRRLEELPRHTVTLTDGYWIGKYEVTQEQWVAIMGVNPSNFTGDPSRPVELVSWDDIQQFLEIINQTEAQPFWRLPSEAEWEFAYRSGNDTRFYWDEDPNYTLIDQYAWYQENSTMTSPVGLKQPNDWGIYDMAGNVMEFCEDWYHNNYDGAPTDGSPWMQPEGTNVVLRGGSWASEPRFCRAAARTGVPPTHQNNVLGFRLVRSAP